MGHGCLGAVSILYQSGLKIAVTWHLEQLLLCCTAGPASHRHVGVIDFAWTRGATATDRLHSSSRRACVYTYWRHSCSVVCAARTDWQLYERWKQQQCDNTVRTVDTMYGKEHNQQRWRACDHTSGRDRASTGNTTAAQARGDWVRPTLSGDGVSSCQYQATLCVFIEFK